jgi:hypothetical protein
VSRTKYVSSLAVVCMAVCAATGLAISGADTSESFLPKGEVVNLVALMPSSAHVAWWVFPTTGPTIVNGLSSDLMVIGRRWILGPGVSFDVHCAVMPPVGQTAELLSLDPARVLVRGASFLERAGARSISLAAPVEADRGLHIDINRLLVIHNGTDSEPTIIHIMVSAI